MSDESERKLRAAALDAYRDHVASLPAHIRAAAEKCPALNDEGRPQCYRANLAGKAAGHYVIVALGDKPAPEGRKAIVTLVHLADSYLPGTSVLDVDPDKLVPCGCGNVIAATQEQVNACADAHRDQFRALKAQEPN